MNKQLFASKLIHLVKEYLSINDKNGYVSIQKIEIEIKSPSDLPLIKLDCVVFEK